jgi:hypothetical protein
MAAAGEHLMHHGLLAAAISTAVSGRPSLCNGRVSAPSPAPISTMGSIGAFDGSQDGVDDTAIVKEILAELVAARMRMTQQLRD